MTDTGRDGAIDVCRGLLFLLMTNTHALTLARVSESHWLFSDFWLPNGWATVAFVVLSGYCIGYIFSVRRQVAERNAALISRGKKIIAVMIVSNFIFSVLEQISYNQISVLFGSDWWFSFFIRPSEWTISGVLLPTGLVLFCGPAMIRFCQNAPWKTLTALVLAQYAVLILKFLPADAGIADFGMLRLLLLGGLGGFPVLPFVLNGCLGIWLGIFKRRCNPSWLFVLAGLMLMQVLIYLSGYIPVPALSVLLLSPFSAAAKYAWVFAFALLLSRFPFYMPAHVALPASAVSLIGKFSLGSFIMHRVFAHALDILTGGGSTHISPAHYYCFLFGGTLALTVLLCFLRDRFTVVNRCFKRLAL